MRHIKSLVPRGRAPNWAFAWVAVFLAFIPACNASAQERNSDWPLYGTWRSPSGFSIEVATDNTYRVCFEELCDTGDVDPDLLVGPLLLDFVDAEKPVAAILLERSRYVDDMTAGGHIPLESPHLQFGLNVGPSIVAEHCGGDPCFRMGGNDGARSRLFTFVLQQ